MRFALLLVASLSLAACSSGGAGGASTTGGGGGALCSVCTSAADCGPGGNCVFETSPTSGYCAAPCIDSGCPEADAMCFSFTMGQGDLYCYPSSRTCQGYVAGNGTGATTGTVAATTTGTAATSSSGGTSGSACASDPDTYANYGSMFMTTYCLPCHNPSFPAYYPPDCTNLSGIQGDLPKILSSITGGLMPLWPDAGFPPNSQTLIAPSDLTRVEAWMGCGAM